ncbi:hypothetical protein SAMN04488591_2211 [Microbacterium azadirachtae]|uniref:DNA-binding transcriptional regulator, MarR family n=1 Tax=Microbacterium azadirachtae TaxID=582680 RepID=A0A1I6HW30_9MICO|nr:hypothetical protein [Microbacterium azadirachtae]SFR58653.1 hypothetical protein SAMN04488591_2211 [Microbacterium azadirachtae]
MNTSQNTTENASSDQGRPFGFWISAVDRLTAARFATAFEDEGITRRDWRLLNVVDGTVPSGRDLPDRKLHHLADLGWVERTADGWGLTPEGVAAKARLGNAVEEIRAEVAAALDPEEFAALAASLEKLARGLGYEEGMRLPRRPDARRGERPGRRSGHRKHGHRHGAGFGHGERFGEREGHGHGERFGRPAHDRFAEHPGFGREWLRGAQQHAAHRHTEHPHGEHSHGEHPHGEHLRGMGPRGRHHRRSAEHIHIHLHHGRRDG